MKKSKILIPALSIASVGTIVAPIVTSCNKGYGGVWVSSADFYYALQILASVYTDTTNYSGNVNIGEASCSFAVEAGKDKECYIVGDKKEFRKMDNGNPQKYDETTKTWKALESGDLDNPSTLVATWASKIGEIVVYGYADFVWKDGALIATPDENSKIVLVFQRLDGDIAVITHMEVTYSGKTVIFNFNKYFETTIEDFPA